jgi:hypothetical protein
VVSGQWSVVNDFSVLSDTHDDPDERDTELVMGQWAMSALDWPVPSEYIELHRGFAAGAFYPGGFVHDY